MGENLSDIENVTNVILKKILKTQKYRLENSVH